jgi:hypothetical protein
MTTTSRRFTSRCGAGDTGHAVERLFAIIEQHFHHRRSHQTGHDVDIPSKEGRTMTMLVSRAVLALWLLCSANRRPW